MCVVQVLVLLDILITLLDCARSLRNTICGYTWRGECLYHYSNSTIMLPTNAVYRNAIPLLCLKNETLELKVSLIRKLFTIVYMHMYISIVVLCIVFYSRYKMLIAYC